MENSFSQNEKGLFLGTKEGNQITEVVVFSNQAFVKRQVKTEATTGCNRYHINTSAYSLDADSVQARVYGSGEILSVLYVQIPIEQAPQEEVRALLDKQLLMKRQLRELQNKLETIAKKKKFLDSVIKFSSTQVPIEIQTQLPEIEKLDSLLQFLDNNYNNIDETQSSLEIKIEDLGLQIKTLNRKITKLQTPTHLTQNVIEVLFQSEKQQQIGIEVSYVSPNASWRPIYKVDVANDLSDLLLTMSANITQNTGENWKDVKLTVSNAVPMKGTKLPELLPWRLHFPKPVPIPQHSQVMLGAAAAGAPPTDDLEGSMLTEEFCFDDFADSAPEAQFQQAEEKQTHLAFEYDLSQPVHIKSGNDATILPLYSRKNKGYFHNYTVPAIDPLTYLVCTTSGESNMLPGHLNVYLAGRFVGGTVITEKKAGEKMHLNLGVDRAIKISREKISDKVSETFFGMMDRASDARELELKISIENLKDENIHLHLIDHVPVAQTDKITIKGLELSPEPSERDWKDREGVMFWNIQMPPNSIKEIHIKFHVKYPKNQVPAGL